MDADPGPFTVAVWELGSCHAGQNPVSFRSAGNARTVAAAWEAWGELDLDDRDTALRIDSEDHWWRAALPNSLYEAAKRGARVTLELPGVATIHDVLVNGVLVAQGVSMFVPIEVDVTDHLVGDDRIEIVVRSLTEYLDSIKWPRPRWKTRLVSDQRLRNVRTALFGRIGWAPPTPVAGPYRGATLHRSDQPRVHQCGLVASVDGSSGTVQAQVDTVNVTRLGLQVGSDTSWLSLINEKNGQQHWAGRVAVAGVERWHPHTHGNPHLYDVTLVLECRNSTTIRHSAGRVGFRTIAVDESDGQFAVSVNEVPVFCRGAVAMPFDAIGATTNEESIRAMLQQAQSAGLNMIRLGGTNWYEGTAFHSLCDELGLLVWQDFSFASLDYPSTAEFQSVVREEVRAHISPLRAHPSTAIVCGSSEVEQQIAMMGLNLAMIADTPGRTWLRDLVHELAPGIRYLSSSPSGGHVPMRVDVGVSHYFGVGAYRRGREDATTSGVRFASECLAFANIPSASAVASLGGVDGDLWRRRVPRDSGSDWDFDDVRNHYVDRLPGVEPGMRESNPERWMELSELVTGDLMASVFRQWRTGSGRCGGGLILSLNDPWASAGWGLFDSFGEPKAALHRLAGVLQPVCVLAVDRGLNGLDLHLINDTNMLREGYLQVRGVTIEGRTVLHGLIPVSLAEHSKFVVAAETVFGRFADPTYAYKFGTQPFHAVVATFLHANPNDDRNENLDDAFCSALHVVRPDWSQIDREPEIEVRRISSISNGFRVCIEATIAEQFVRVGAIGASASQSHFDLGPGQRLSVDLTWPIGSDPVGEGTIRSLTAARTTTFSLPSLR
jgi:beta-mannosidase